MSDIVVDSVQIIESEMINCNLSHIDFSTISDGEKLSVQFMNCAFTGSHFLLVDLSSCKFINCGFHFCMFNETTFKGSILDKCDFSDAQFYHTDFSSVDLRTVTNMIASYAENNFSKAIFSSDFLNNGLF